MARRGENIYERKDGRWEARYIYEYDLNGKAKYKYIYGKSYQEVKQKKQECEQRLMKLRGKARPSPVITFSELTDNWLANVKIRGKDSTYACYCSRVKKHIRPFLGMYQVSKISTELIELHVSRLLCSRDEGGYGLSPKTVEDILIIIKSIFRFGNCYDSLDLQRIKIKKKDKKPQTLSKIEQFALRQHLLNDADFIKAGILFCLCTGIRIGELCALRFSDIDFYEGTVHIERTMQRIQIPEAEVAGKKTKIVITSPKSARSIRDIPLPEFLTENILKLKGRPDAFFLTGNESYMEPRSLQNHFKKCIKASGIKDYNFHALRHTFATEYVEAGFDVKSLSEILGHSSVKITLERYVHSSVGLKRSNIDKLAEILFYSPSESSSMKCVEGL